MLRLLERAHVGLPRRHHLYVTPSPFLSYISSLFDKLLLPDCLRALCAVDMPLNGGCLAPIDVRIPKGSLLQPSEEAAVCGGNVLTSQRITDVVLKAFNACAASQGEWA